MKKALDNYYLVYAFNRVIGRHLYYTRSQGRPTKAQKYGQDCDYQAYSQNHGTN